MSQLSREMDRVFDDFWRDPFGRSPSRGVSNELGGALWAPAIEMHEHEGELIVRADLPGLKKEEVQVEVNDRTLMIQGERLRSLAVTLKPRCVSKYDISPPPAPQSRIRAPGVRPAAISLAIRT